MRVDQVAVDLFWKAPGKTRQVIRGLRKRELLPVKDFRYYIDRLTAVQDGYGDFIAIGEGRDVRSVPHPLGPGSETLYQFETVDSVRLTVESLPLPVRVHEIRVRPRDASRPGFVGSVFLDAESGALTRMAFSFTPASYVDPRVDNIRVTLEHGFWEGAHWLPFRQTIEVRREIPEVDLPVGSMIRATLQVASYEFNPELAPDFFDGPRVTSVAYGTADSTEFRSGLMERMGEEGLSPVSLASLEAEARGAVKARLVSGLPQVRLFTDQLSSIVRANRAEGMHLGVGASFSPDERVRLEGLSGYGLGSRRPTGELRVRFQSGPESATSLRLELYARQLRDLGPRPGLSGALNTVSSVFLNQDYLDPYFASGGRLGVVRVAGPDTRMWLGAVWEQYRSGTQVWQHVPVGGRPLRPVWPAEEGPLSGMNAGLERRWGGLEAWGASATLQATGARWAGGNIGSVLARFQGRFSTADLTRRAALSFEAGRSWGAVPNQLLFFVGGRGTLPAHPYRAFGGQRFALVQGEASVGIVPGWLTGRLIGGAGAVGATPAAIQGLWGTRSSGGVLGYVGVGLATLHDVVRVDGAWAPGTRAFELILSLDPRLRPYL